MIIQLQRFMKLAKWAPPDLNSDETPDVVHVHVDPADIVLIEPFAEDASEIALHSGRSVVVVNSPEFLVTSIASWDNGWCCRECLVGNIEDRCPDSCEAQAFPRREEKP